MRLKKILTHFFILMALTTNISFIASPNGYELVITIAMNMLATILKMGEGKILSNELMASSLVADLHLIPAGFIYFLGDTEEAVGLAIGALAANIISIVIGVIETILVTFTEEEE
ncbi:MAG: hypothetical protein GXO03_01880 [Aquificae bacterium]|nr:hypothetical protein [Aquificota bacterium]